eukprot:TRINITY_DN12302_c0_g1_i1.p1 TRINITY_DN12302_c0_g1~~TRINITY_DN12302_c0_g1_i1.p1  ORF type:complete len:239 (+),score=7.06 TRINITY_DN12302_c0_g1_i1:177-893(+)
MPGSDLPTWVNLLGGGLGAAAGSTATGPLEVVKTRMQSSKYAYTKPNADAPWIYRNSVTLRALTTTLRDEGVLSLWRGLGPTLVGIIPSRACYFAMYNGSKPLVAKLNDGHENSAVHLGAGLIAGIVTSTVTSPIWVIKTRVQLANMQGSSSSFDVIRSTWQQEGFKGFFKGLAASYAGTVCCMRKNLRRSASKSKCVSHVTIDVVFGYVQGCLNRPYNSRCTSISRRNFTLTERTAA